MTDDELIAWVANAAMGQMLPARMTLVEVLDRLVRNGFPATGGDSYLTLATRARLWAREYLERQQ